MHHLGFTNLDLTGYHRTHNDTSNTDTADDNRAANDWTRCARARARPPTHPHVRPCLCLSACLSLSVPLSFAPAPFPPPLRSCVPISPSTVCQRSLRAAPVQACAMPYEVWSGWSHPIGRPSLQNHLDTPCGFLVDASVLALRR